MYQSLVADISKIKEYREELAVAIFLAGLQHDLASQIRGQILGADSLASSAILDQTVMVASKRGHGTRGTRERGHDDRSGGGNRLCSLHHRALPRGKAARSQQAGRHRSRPSSRFA